MTACVTAADEAAQRLDFASAVHWHLQTLPLLLDDAARAETHLAVGRVAYQDGQVSEALEHAQIAADLAVRLGRTDLLVEAALVVTGIGGVRWSLFWPSASALDQPWVRSTRRDMRESSPNRRACWPTR